MSMSSIRDAEASLSVLERWLLEPTSTDFVVTEGILWHAARLKSLAAAVETEYNKRRREAEDGYEETYYAPQLPFAFLELEE